MNYTFPPQDSPNKANFAFWENFLSENDINKILASSEWDNLIRGQVGSEKVIKETVRETDIAWYKQSESNKEIWEKLAYAAMDVNSNFFKFDLTGFYEPAQLGYYTWAKQSHYSWHIDADVSKPKVPRKLSMVLQLNDPSEFEGGELQIKTVSDEPISLELKRGRAWFFPSYFLHRVTPVTKGVRKTLVLWITGPEFK